MEKNMGKYGVQRSAGLPAVSSVMEAGDILKSAMRPGMGRVRRELVDAMTQESNHIVGTVSEYHNFIMDLFRVGDYYDALRLCDYALGVTPKNCDLLADAIRACGNCGLFDRGEEYFARALALDKAHWHWRLFLYGVSFLQSRLKAEPGDEELFRRAYDLAEEYIRYFPYDEHGYNQVAELLISDNRRDDAIEKLKTYIYELQPDKNDRRSALVTAQCCVTLLELLDDTNDYELIIQTAKKGIRNAKTEQLSASVGYFAYRWALALDAIVADENYANPVRVKETLVRYQAAYDISNDAQYSRIIEQNYALLRSFADPKDNVGPLLKRPLVVREGGEKQEAKDE